MKKLLVTSLLLSSASVLAAPFTVQDIRVEGTDPVTAENIIAGLPVKVGQRANDQDLSQIVRSLFLRGGYENVEAVREGNALVLRIQARPYISSLEIEGNKQIPKDALETNLRENGIAKGEILEREKLESFRQELLNYYHSAGYTNAEINTIVDDLGQGRAALKLEIKENDGALVKEINFVGNNAFSDSKLLDQTEIQPDVSWWNIFSSSKFSNPKFEKDLNTLRDFYLNQGYAKFKIVDTDVQYSDDKKDINLTITMDEGEKYTINDVRIIGDTAGMSADLNQLLANIKRGEQFRGNTVKAIEDGIKNTLGARGYANPQITIQPDFDDANHTVDLIVVVDAGRRYYVRSIRFEGNDVSADSTLRQEMRQQEGSWLSTALIEQGKYRLERTGFYETVESQTLAVPGVDDQLDVLYKVKERNTGSINFGIGFGTESGLSYQASVKQDNFLGMGSSVSLSGVKNKYATSVNLGYTEPYFTRDGVSLGGNIFYDTYDYKDSDTTASYARTSYGINGTLGFPVNENNSYYLGVGYVHNKLKNMYPEYNRARYLRSMGVNDWRIKSDDFEFSLGWNYNTLNRGFLPTNGTRASIGGKITIPGSDNKYYKLSADITSFYPLNYDQTWVLSGKATLSYANGFGDKKLPFYQNYSAGGIGSLRGFAYGAVGPRAIYNTQSGASVNDPARNYNNINYDVVGGNAMATASVELIMPTPFVSDKNQNTVRTSLFVDAASVWNTEWKKDKANLFTQGNIPQRITDYGDPSQVRASAGLAFQWNSPIGPLVFSYAKPIKKYEGDEIEQFQFSIGGSF
ncbi:Beta-barrel assembly machine subunit BamA [Pasteurella testudinis DSM 23072]|uniref:Outer membrane protein assembly factor BamA n=1 Tax=Pasteurella testudinis DSM 23072 TaxID=1122938 RepID=A0A1W1UAB9_9PAST|nr:outer membrane protein assembly factor BamA [Pasteurella testudinis]SMB78025.1 Beta-barrel assembly machine subunit BamA [Pasteurella testudinis DSM 23072]SUB52707.1 protective surface antigen D15 [Pasteurella testudinis]